MKLKQVWQDGQCRLAVETGNGWVDVAAESSRRGITASALSGLDMPAGHESGLRADTKTPALQAARNQPHPWTSGI